MRIVEQWRAVPSPEADERVDATLTSGAFSRRSRLSPKALRLYDEQGLLTPHRLDPVNGYRCYLESQLPAARLIAALRRLDMPLDTIAKILAAPADQAADILVAYWDEIEARVAVQREVAAHVRRRLVYGEHQSELAREVRPRAVPRQVVLTEQRHVLQQDLVPYLQTGMPRAAQTADEQLGGIVGPLFVVFHGEVSFDSDGPVEICVPVDVGHEGRADHPIRVEPSHDEAYLRLRKAQVGHPQILSAYDAVTAWTNANGHVTAGSPREIYFAKDFDAAGSGDEVCDVALPIRRGGAT